MIVVIMLAAFAAQGLGGSVGIGADSMLACALFGLGLTPAVAITTLHLSKAGVGLGATVAHTRAGNVHWPTVARLAIPGSIAAGITAAALAAAISHSASTVTCLALAALGGIVLFRFGFGPLPSFNPAPSGWVAPAGLIGGAFSVTSGLGWASAPVSVLLSTTRAEPRHVLGSTAAAGTMVSFTAAIVLFWRLPQAGIVWPLVAGITVAGVLVAPFVAWIVRRLPPAVLGVSSGAALMALNLLYLRPSIPAWAALAGLLAIAGLWMVALAHAIRTHRRVGGVQAALTPGHSSENETDTGPPRQRETIPSLRVAGPEPSEESHEPSPALRRNEIGNQTGYGDDPPMVEGSGHRHVTKTGSTTI
ncbi:sulfite exporter TauE/SafE family protein [Natronoglycomyces albus]|uniref:Probable membrane transporter protein n=1 Tax=Natronoglycomyces albus TaxID=2811108 RepID=A0A895XN72_9ACTN|nr:sulfite exporter TauE/SafE family protein [Natronoglycomyces albus]QSB04983.1 sulfite exporter TauE/SafE family protein [Natronoglycomyces albus]